MAESDLKDYPGQRYIITFAGKIGDGLQQLDKMPEQIRTCNQIQRERCSIVRDKRDFKLHFGVKYCTAADNNFNHTISAT